MRGNRCCVFQRQVVNAKPYSSLYKLNFWLVKTIFSYFFGYYCHRKQLLHLVKTNFSANSLFGLVETYFLSSGNHKLFSFQWKRICNESFIPAIGEGFFLWWKGSNLLENSFLLAKTVTDLSGSHFLKTELILASGNHFLLLPQIFLKKFFIPAGGNTFSVQKKKYCFLLRTFFPASANNYSNYREAYLKFLSLLLATVFFDFSDISAKM